MVSYMMQQLSSCSPRSWSWSRSSPWPPGERVVHVDDGDVLGAQPLVLLAQVRVPRLHRLEARDRRATLLLPLRVEGVDHCAQLLEGRFGVIVALEELFLGLIHGGYLFDLRSFWCEFPRRTPH